MDPSTLIPLRKQVITGHGSGEFKIGGDVHRNSVLVFSDRTLPWNIAPHAAISLESLAPVLAAAGKIDLLLIGCSKSQMAMPPKIRTALQESGIALDVMDTPGACRQFNILLAEGKRVAAALVAV